MSHPNSLFEILNIDVKSAVSLKKYASLSGIDVSRLKYYQRAHNLPTGGDLDKICKTSGITPVELMLKMGQLNSRIISAIQTNADRVYEIIQSDVAHKNSETQPPPLAFETEFGKLYRGDCLDLTASMADDSIDLIFADPPFNLNKLYPSKINDNLKEKEYLRWCEEWVDECARILKPGGSLFIWNLPKWNTSLAEFLNARLTFRHWIAVDIKYSLPIPGRLYPSHYALLYYCKGERPNKFHPDRLPMEICPHCMGDLRDYGGYKSKMNPKGVNLADVWFDIPPVRHAKYKKRKNSNELSIRLMDRIIEMASDEDDMVFDPFGGAGTTYIVAEIKKRRWTGVELGPVADIIKRFDDISSERTQLNKIRSGYNALFTPENATEREKRGLWTSESVKNNKKSKSYTNKDMNETANAMP